MFFKETLTKNSKSSMLQLVENIRTNKGPRQRLIVSLGTYFKIPKKDRREVATIVQNRLKGQQVLFETPPLKTLPMRIKLSERFRQRANGTLCEIR